LGRPLRATGRVPWQTIFLGEPKGCLGGTTNRDATLARWAADLQNDFRARMDWCVKPFAQANHPPLVRIRTGTRRTVKSGETIVLDASESTDPDGQPLSFEWFIYREAGTCQEQARLENPASSVTRLTAPSVSASGDIHISCGA